MNIRTVLNNKNYNNKGQKLAHSLLLFVELILGKLYGLNTLQCMSQYSLLCIVQIKRLLLINLLTIQVLI